LLQRHVQGLGIRHCLARPEFLSYVLIQRGHSLYAFMQMHLVAADFAGWMRQDNELRALQSKVRRAATAARQATHLPEFIETVVAVAELSLGGSISGQSLRECPSLRFGAPFCRQERALAASSGRGRARARLSCRLGRYLRSFLRL